MEKYACTLISHKVARNHISSSVLEIKWSIGEFSALKFEVRVVYATVLSNVLCQVSVWRKDRYPLAPFLVFIFSVILYLLLYNLATVILLRP